MTDFNISYPEYGDTYKPPIDPAKGMAIAIVLMWISILLAIFSLIIRS